MLRALRREHEVLNGGSVSEDEILSITHHADAEAR
jgi:hypothetical protein